MKINEFELNIDTETVDINGKKIEIKNHLISDEIVNIAECMLKEDNEMTREVVRGIMLTYFCTNIEIEEEDGVLDIDPKVYDILNTNGIIEAIESVVNERDLMLIEEYVYKAESVNKTIENICNDFNETLKEQAEKVDVAKFTDSIKELQDGIQKH